MVYQVQKFRDEVGEADITAYCITTNPLPFGNFIIASELRRKCGEVKSDLAP